MAKRPRMVGWFDPPQLASTALRVAISHVFGEFVDRREAMASAREIDPGKIDPVYSYAAEGGRDFWFDFVADTGDGFNPTFAVARLLAEPTLAVEGAAEALPRGRLLVMGGDQIYPTPSRVEYQERLVAPFEEAERGTTWPADKPHLYAVPGNHDWYDGLSAFLGLFSRRRKPDAWTAARPGREFGGRITQQTRSYFALQLPNGWWLWGADIQLSGYIDQPQIDFFTHVAREWMDDGSKLIICTGQPNWTHVDPANPKPAFENFSYFERLAGLAAGSGKRHELRAVLTGDSHHYAHYVEGHCHYITAGGGGAFLHPTHQLEEKVFDWDYPPPGVAPTPGQAKYRRAFTFARKSDGKPALFPDTRTSHLLALRNFAFAALNWQYTAGLAIGCLFFAWLLHAQAATLDLSLMALLAAAPTLWGSILAYVDLVFISPWPPALVLIGAGAYYYLADFHPKWRRLIAGGVHTVLHAAVVVVASCLLARGMVGLPNWTLIVAIGAVGGVLSATLAGLYFMLSLNFFGVHWNEAFSALRIQDYKCFLRLRIRPDGGLDIYPIGLTDVPRESRRGPLRRPPLKPHLIEGPVRLGTR